MKLFQKSLIKAVLICMPLMLSGMAHAKVKIYIKNCSNNDRYFDIYNGNDSTLAVPRRTIEVEKKGDWKSVKCKGGGRHRCKVSVVGSDQAKNVKGKHWYHFESGKSYTIDSDEKKCSDL